MEYHDNNNVSSLEELNAKYDLKKPRRGKKTKMFIISAVMTIIFLSGFAYSFISSIEEMKATAMNSLENSLKDVGSSIEYNNKRTADYEANLNSLINNCRDKGECNIEEITTESFIPSISKFGGFSLESAKFLLEWHKEKLGNETLTNDCAGFSKPVGITLSEMLGIAETVGGYMNLTQQNTVFIGKISEEIKKLNLTNSSQNAEIVKNKVSDESAKFLKSYFEELKQSYKNSKEGRIKEFSERLSKIMENAKKEFKYDVSKEVFINLCMGSINSQFVSYHKEFIENSYSEFESLVNQGKYEEAITYSNIISGFLAGFSEGQGLISSQ